MNHIVLLPGLGCDEWVFTHQIQALKDDHELKTITPNPFKPLSEHIDYILEQAPDKFALIGHSLGGWFAQWVAIRAPGRVEKLVLMGTCTGKFGGDAARMAESMNAFFGMQQHQNFLHHFKIPGFVNPMMEQMNWLNAFKDFNKNLPMPEGIQQIKRDLDAMNTTARLGEIICNTLLIHGKQDVLFAQEMNFLRQQIAHNTYIEIDQCGHMLPLEQPGFISDIIKSWLRK